MQQRAPKRDEEVDTARTIYWFRGLGDHLGTHTPREIQRVIAPNTLGRDSTGERIRNSKFLSYSRGNHVPQALLVRQAEKVVPRSALALNHPLWMALRTNSSIQKFAHDLIRQLDPDIQRIVMWPHGEVGGGANRHTLGSLERRAGMDSLATLTILFRLNHEAGESEWAWLCAHSIFRVLLMMGPRFDQRTVAEHVFRIYVERIFSLVVFQGQRMALDDYDYPTRSWLLQQLADEVRDQHEPQRERRLPTFYALEVLNGKYHLKLSRIFQVPLITQEKEGGSKT